MTRDELLQLLRSMGSGDEEMEHINADCALLRYIGDAEITVAYKWHA